MIFTCRKNPDYWCENDWSICLTGNILLPYKDAALMTHIRIQKDYKLIQQFQEYYNQRCNLKQESINDLDPEKEWVCFECREFERIEYSKPQEAREEEQRVKDALSWLVDEAQIYPDILNISARFVLTGNGGC